MSHQSTHGREITPTPFGRCRVAGLTLCAIFAIFDGSSQACGPFFPNQIIVEGDSRLIAMPTGDFTAEMRQLQPADMPPFKPVQIPGDESSVYVWSAKMDESELQQALARSGADDAAVKRVVGRYAAAREQVAQHAQAKADDKKKGLSDHIVRELPPIDATVPVGLPGEFVDYLRGLIAQQNGDVAGSRSAWRALLARPAAERRFRSTWAAFQLGRSYLTENPDEARKMFATTRELAAAGFADSLGLAESSMGWEARSRLSEGKFAAAIDLYLEQLAAGDRTAPMSLRDSARAAFAAGTDALRGLAADPPAQRVIAAYVLSNGGPFAELSAREKSLVPIWLGAVESAGAKGVAGAGELAWAAYGIGDFHDAKRWVARAPAESTVAQWVRAKLLLRDGKIDAAAAVLANVVRSFPREDQWPPPNRDNMPDDPGDTTYRIGSAQDGPDLVQPIAGDLAVLQLSRTQYTDSLDLLLRGDFLMDAAYVAERVLTADDLKDFVDRHYPPGSNSGVSMSRQEDTPQFIRYLLGRRLTRLGRRKDARQYYPPDMQPVLDQYIAAIRAGHETKRTNAERAASLMTAARIARRQGMELLGTELEPDYFCYGGNYSDGPLTAPRVPGNHLSAASADEAERFKENAPADERRFHYRYIAAEHAWEASQLLPDDTDQAAAVLNEAGCWLKDRDPHSALRFYKALVTRCPSTALGKQAEAKHWFIAPPGEN
jgi:hypothetical protein